MITFHGVTKDYDKHIVPQPLGSDHRRRQICRLDWATTELESQRPSVLITPTGSIEVDGQDLYSHRLAIKKKIGYVCICQIFSCVSQPMNSGSCCELMIWVRKLPWSTLGRASRGSWDLFSPLWSDWILFNMGCQKLSSSLQPSCQIQLFPSLGTNRWIGLDPQATLRFKNKWCASIGQDGYFLTIKPWSSWTTLW